MNKLINQIDNIIKDKPKICITLGSGLDSFIKKLKNSKILKYDDITGFLKTRVEGHSGQFVYGYIKNIPVLCAQGRFHYYEGYTFDEVGIIIKLFNHYKPKKTIITNSSGCLRLDWDIGDLMIVKEFIDFSFIASNKPIHYKLNTTINNDLNIRVGNYTYTIGPTYETKAEIEEIIKEGGDAVGMSTFPEYLMCKKLNIKPIIISCLTNYGAGLVNQEVKHEDVLNNADKFKKEFNELIIKIIQNI